MVEPHTGNIDLRENIFHKVKGDPSFVIVVPSILYDAENDVCVAMADAYNVSHCTLN